MTKAWLKSQLVIKNWNSLVSLSWLWLTSQSALSVSVVNPEIAKGLQFFSFLGSNNWVILCSDRNNFAGPFHQVNLHLQFDVAILILPISQDIKTLPKTNPINNIKNECLEGSQEQERKIKNLSLHFSKLHWWFWSQLLYVLNSHFVF